MTSLLVVIKQMRRRLTVTGYIMMNGPIAHKASPRTQPPAIRETSLGRTDVKEAIKSQTAICWMQTTIKL